ncbi:MAG: hypothetical protein R3C42_08045 [Parvularculaceae bacterium]
MRADPSELLQQGQDALNRGENARALNIFSNLVKIGPHSVGAWCGYAASLYGSGRFERALSAAKEAVRLGPDDFRTYSVLAPPAFLMDCEVGIQTCRDYILTLSRNDAESLAGFWSSRLAEKDHFIAAARAFSFFAERYLDEEDTAHELAHHYLNAQELDKVEDLLGVIEKNFGDSAAALCMRARIEIIRGDAKAAKAAALKAIELNARAIPAYVILSELSPELVDASNRGASEKALDEGALPDEMRIGGYRALGRAAEKRVILTPLSTPSTRRNGWRSRPPKARAAFTGPPPSNEERALRLRATPPHRLAPQWKARRRIAFSSSACRDRVRR